MEKQGGKLDWAGPQNRYFGESQILDSKVSPDKIGRQRTDHSPKQVGVNDLVRGDQFYMIGLTQTANIGPVLGRSLLGHFGSAREIFHSTKKDLMRIPGIGSQIASNILKGRGLIGAEKELKLIEKHAIKVISLHDQGYPDMLRKIYDAPLIIYQKGELNLNDQLHIAVVGTRMPSGYGQIVAEQFSSHLVDHGCCVVSGLAFGVDGIVHRTALKRKGKTVGILGHGLGTIYPREHTREAKSITESGALLSEFGAEVLPEARNFPMRNRIISGLCHATVVIEAGEKGGALITARMAFEQNREVYAIPGDLTRPQSAGSNFLIRNQIAKILLHPSEILEDLKPMVSSISKQVMNPIKHSPNLNEDEKRILHFISKDPSKGEAISSNLNIELGKLRGVLVNLEVKGYVKLEVGGTYRLFG